LPTASSITAHHGAAAPTACPGLKLTDARAAAVTKIARIIIFHRFPSAGWTFLRPLGSSHRRNGG
ncbi:MAG: hypothetical protein WCE27_23735, partial [Pseudolabrys sp.]